MLLLAIFFGDLDKFKMLQNKTGSLCLQLYVPKDRANLVVTTHAFVLLEK